MPLARRPAAAVPSTVLATVLAVGCTTARLDDQRNPHLVDRPTGRSGGEARTDPLSVLRAWDARRSRAWAHGDVAALRDLYATRSSAGRRDVALLRDYLDRGLRVEGLTTQVLRADLRMESGDRLVVAVTDRLVGGVAVGPGVRVRLPSATPRTRQVTLVRRDDGWVVTEVRRGLPTGPR